MFRPYIQAAENRTEIIVDFRVNVAQIEPGFSDNLVRLQEIVDFITTLSLDSTINVTSVAFCGAASPEGPYEWNSHLAVARRESLEAFVRSRLDIPDSIVRRDDSYIPWDYLRREICESGHPLKDTVISILDEPPVLVKNPDNGKMIDRRILKLRQLDNKRVWNRLLRPHFSKMRNASAVIITYKEDKNRLIDTPDFEPASISKGTAAAVGLNLLPESCGKGTRSRRAPLLMSVYTNMLFDAMAIPNIGVDFHLGKNWSVAANWMYAWWSRDPRHRYWRAYGGDINVRYWFGKTAQYRPLSGHHIAVYGQMLTYDLELGGKGILGDRWTWGAGVAYGYSLPLSRHFNIDFTIGFGYATGEYKKYHPEDGCYVWESTHRLNWFGPTKAEVSLVWLVGSAREGGGR